MEDCQEENSGPKSAGSSPQEDTPDGAGFSNQPGNARNDSLPWYTFSPTPYYTHTPTQHVCNDLLVCLCMKIIGFAIQTHTHSPYPITHQHHEASALYPMPPPAEPGWQGGGYPMHRFASSITMSGTHPLSSTTTSRPQP